MASLHDFFSTNNFMPHGHCYLWRPGILWLHAISDSLIALSYFSIPIMLYYFIYKKQNIPYKWLFKFFAAFIFCCGLTHLTAIWTIWEPVYQLQGLVKAITASVSLLTVLFLIPVLPALLSLRSPKELEKLNDKLETALRKKSKAEHKLTKANIELEEQVAKRTEQLTKYSNKLQLVNTELESFAHQASHDLKSPLSTSLAFLEQLNSDPNNLEKYKICVPKVKSNLKRLNTLITDLLDLSKIGEIDTVKEWISLEDIMSDVKANLNYLIDERQARIYLDNLFDVHANKTQLTLVLQNLIENAIKYVDVHISPEIICSTYQKNNSWVFEIKDNGIGIAKDDIENIFKPFYRIYSSDERTGTGLGLSICKKIILNHGGTIAVDSTPRIGTTFRFTLPRP